MSPKKVTIIDRDRWDPIGSRTSSKKEILEAQRKIEDFYNDIGIVLHMQKSTLVDLY
ncbi:hypothetical protein [Methanobrevibacter millerae]|uniref:Uncharacterized protein n=1 Tax=Methanobrevibacter millerae TaxID=230361 RepID=A0A1G5XNW5_9EURY|nr:hypothetical protein [Methanobrevibacter millerae]SDA71880.1 hypothetical protein SAMN02910315_02383 [Methanobrevibacter millerae]